MKRIPSVLAAGTLAGFMALAPESAAALPEYCTVDVYDETSTAKSGRLQAVIGEFAVDGVDVDVHVQVFQDPSAVGIYTDDDAGRFSQQVKDICKWPDPNQIDVLISLDPRTTKLNVYGTPDDISGSRINAAMKPYITDLQDVSTPYQDDVAGLLEELLPLTPGSSGGQDTDPYEPSQPYQPSQPQVESEPFEFPDIPWKPVGGGLAGAAALGYGVGRIRRGQSVRGEFERGKQQLETIKGSLLEAQEDARKLLVSFLEGDAQKFQDHYKLADGNTDTLTAALAKLDTERKAARNRVWPNLFEAEMSANNATELAYSMSEYVASLKQQTLEVNGFLMGLEGQDAKFDEVMQDMRKAATTAQEDQGWYIGRYEQQIAALVEAQKAIDVLLAEGYVEKPAKQMDEYDDKILALQDELEDLPEDRAKADSDYDAQAVEIKTRAGQIAGAKKTLAELAAEYDRSCYADLDDVSRSLDTHFAELSGNHVQHLQFRGVKTVDALDTSLAANAAFDTTLGTLDNTIVLPKNRVAELQTIVAELPKRLGRITTGLGEVRQFAFITERDDVEDDVRAEVEGLETSFSHFVTAEVEVPKPKYLEVDTSVDTYRDSVGEVKMSAEQQYNEMVNLRSLVSERQSTNQRAAQSLRNYVSSNSGDIDYSLAQTVRGLQLGSYSTNANRLALRNSASALDSESDEIQSMLNQAKQDVAAAEAERAAEARRKAAAEAEERRREQAAADAQRAAASSMNSGGSGRSGSTYGGSY